MMSTEAIEETPQAVEEVTDPGDIEVVNEVLDPKADPRAAMLHDIDLEIDKQADLQRACQAEANRLNKLRRPTAGYVHDITTVDDGHNANITKLVKEQLALADNAEDRRHELEAEAAKLRKAIRKDAEVKRNFWKGNERATLRDLGRQENVLRAELRKLERGQEDTTKRKKEHFEELDKQRFMKTQIARRLAEAAAKNDPLHPEHLRDAKKDLSYMTEVVSHLEIEYGGIVDAIAAQQTKIDRLKRSLKEIEFTKFKVEWRVVHEQYGSWALTGAPILEKMFRLQVYANQQPSTWREGLAECVRWPEKYGIFHSVICLPRMFFAGEEIIDGAKENFYWRQEGGR